MSSICYIIIMAESENVISVASVASSLDSACFYVFRMAIYSMPKLRSMARDVPQVNQDEKPPITLTRPSTFSCSFMVEENFWRSTMVLTSWRYLDVFSASLSF